MGGGADTDDGSDGGEETPEEFEERVYLALMDVARASSPRLRRELGSCVLLGTAYATAPAIVRVAIREFIATAEL